MLVKFGLFPMSAESVSYPFTLQDWYSSKLCMKFNSCLTDKSAHAYYKNQPFGGD